MQQSTATPTTTASFWAELDYRDALDFAGDCVDQEVEYDDYDLAQEHLAALGLDLDGLIADGLLVASLLIAEQIEEAEAAQ
jgi:hypothetical protein